MLIGHSDRAEFATEEFLSCNTAMENFVIIKRNPDYEAEKEQDGKGKKK